MKKSDLKTGMLVELRNGEIHLVINDILLAEDGYLYLYDYNDNLICDYEDNTFDIVAVSGQLTGGQLSMINWNKKQLEENIIWRRSSPVITIDGVEYSESTLRSLIKKATGE